MWSILNACESQVEPTLEDPRSYTSDVFFDLISKAEMGVEQDLSRLAITLQQEHLIITIISMTKTHLT